MAHRQKKICLFTLMQKYTIIKGTTYYLLTIIKQIMKKEKKSDILYKLVYTAIILVFAAILVMMFVVSAKEKEERVKNPIPKKIEVKIKDVVKEKNGKKAGIVMEYFSYTSHSRSTKYLFKRNLYLLDNGDVLSFQHHIDETWFDISNDTKVELEIGSPINYEKKDNIFIYRGVETREAFETVEPEKRKGMSELVTVTDIQLSKHSQKNCSISFSDGVSFKFRLENLSPKSEWIIFLKKGTQVRYKKFRKASEFFSQYLSIEKNGKFSEAPLYELD